MFNMVYKRLAVKPDTWQRVNQMKYELQLDSVDSTIKVAINVLDVIRILAEKERISLEDMLDRLARVYEIYSRRRGI